ncbi:MAG: hypothetical protein IT371_00280, partial [Deltaproteobacteria bacterium]|nr:hypothetical protein [Deltaproteobacteria bacterium]
RSDGKRPNTPCACYNVYFEPKCCEQANCILPAGTDGQLCGKSAGQLCDYCNAQKPECTGTGAKCLPLPGGQTICSRSCSKQNPCPTGYDCVPIFSGGAFGNVCIPKGGTCPPKA